MTRSRLGLALAALAVLFLLFDATIKLLLVPEVIAGTAELGWRPELARPLGLLLLGCLAVYAWPRTAILGAILLTGYLGGAVATHVRIGNPLFSHVLFPTYVAALLWGALYLRDDRLRALLPLLPLRR